MRTALLVSLIVLPLSAFAQVYSWKDANGKVHYGDQPPADRAVATRRVNTAASAGDPTARQAAADKRMDDKKQAKDDTDKKAQAEKNKAEDERRRQDCERAKVNYQGLESGQIRYRMGANGEREALDDEPRAEEMARTKQIMDSVCGPKPTAQKK